MTPRLSLLLPLLLAGFIAARGQDQLPAIAITGTVLDQNAEALAGAEVTLKGSGPVRALSTTTDASGAFRFEKLNAGVYEILVTREGFKPATARVTIGNRAPAPVRIILPVADLQQEVSVSASDTQINTDAGGNLDVVAMNRDALNNLPALDQNYIDALSGFLSAGATGTGGVTLVVDGMEAAKVGLSPSAIQEVKINNNPYSAEYSRPGRGRIEVVTKPGSAEFHGDFNLLFRDHRLNARSVFAETRQPEQRRIYEGNVTGPLLRSKAHPTSFLISFEREEDDLQSIIVGAGPNGTIRDTFPRKDRDLDFSVRLTRQVSEKSTLSATYSYEQESGDNQGVGGFNLPEVATNFKNHEDLLRFNHNWVVSPKLVNQISVLFGRYDTPTVSVNQARRIVVQDNFTTGGAQADVLRTEAHWTLNEALTWSQGKHVVKGGIQVPDFSRRGLNDRSNSAGTFYFSSLQDYLDGRPFKFEQQQGVTKLVFWEVVAGVYAQDEIRLRPNLSAALGLRYDRQNYFNGDDNNFAPRLSVAWAPGKSRKTVVRGGLGVFYDRTGPSPIFDLLRFDGRRLKKYVISNPGFPDPFSAGQSSPSEPSSIVRLAPDVVIPYTVQSGIGVERQLQKSLTLTVNYYNTRGVNLFRSRDANAPLASLFGRRPDPNFSLVRQIESTGRQSGHSLELGLRGNITPYFSGMVQYVFGHARNDTGGITSFPANSYNLTGEWGRADFDVRHKFNLLGAIKAGKYFNLGVALALNTGAPYTIVTGRDDNNDSLTLERPAGVGRNTMEGPGLAQLDLRWSREFRLNRRKKDEGPKLTVGMNALNVTNRVNFAGYVGNLNSPFFGQAVAARPSRRLQLSLQFAF
jgi:outer membrane receptor protein involved in Fe transport